MKPQSKSLVVTLATPIFLLIAFGIMFKAFSLLGADVKPMITILISTSPIWLPILVFLITFDMWIWSVREKFKYESGRTTLRIKLPQEVFKSPEAMESVFTQIHNSGRPDNVMQSYLQGKHSLVFSFELASVGGEVRFYVNVPTQKTKNAIESQLYAQYPGIEVTEEKVDYTAEIKWNPEKWDLISFHMGKKNEEIYPIKTYIDYGMDKLPKEELKFEPMAPMLEHLGKAKPHERVWIQFLCVSHDVKELRRGDLYSKPTWVNKATAEIDKIMRRNKDKLGEEETESRPTLTMSERDTVGAIERNTSKYAYEVAIRAMYIAEVGKFDPDMISPLIRGFSQFDIVGRNAIGARWRTDFDYNFISDFSGRRKLAWKKSELESYKARFYLPKEVKGMSDTMKVMSVEELATMYHIPGTAIVTPTISRVESLRREAPSNLPTAQQY